MNQVDRERLHKLKENIRKSSDMVSLSGVAAKGKYYAKTPDGKLVAMFFAPTPDAIPEMQANAHVFTYAPGYILLLSRMVEEAEKRLGEALADRDEARAEVERLREVVRRMTAPAANEPETDADAVEEREYTERLRDAAERYRKATAANETKGAAGPLPCPFHSDGKHRCIGCGEVK